MAESDSVQSIVDFAIQREQAAVDFYSQLAAAAKISSVAAELRRIAKMEEGHRDRLRALDVQSVAASIPEVRGGVRIADYTVSLEPGPQIIWQQVIDIAIQREAASQGLYSALGRLTGNPQAKDLFESLAGEEDGHRAYFQKLYDEHIFFPADSPGRE